jgi:hypothetical protein
MSVAVEAPKPAPVAASVARLRQVFVEAVTEDDVRAVVKTLVDLTKDRDLRAARLLLQYAFGKPGITASLEVAPQALQHDARRAPAAPAFDVTRDSLLGGQAVSDQIIRQIQQERAADSKRVKPSERTPISVPPGHACARTEAMCLVNLPGSKRS